MSIFKSKKHSWNNWEYSLNNQSINDKIINKAVDIFFKNFLDEVNPDEYFLALIVRFRISDTNQIRTICKLQRITLSSKEYLKTFLSIKKEIIQEEYDNVPVNGIIFSWGQRKIKDKKTFIDTIREQLAIENKASFHIHRKIKLPFGSDLSLWGYLITDLSNFKSINLGYGRIANVEIQHREDGFTYYLGQLISKGVVKLNWEDRIINLKTNEIVRTIGNTIFFFKGGEVKSWSTMLKAKPISQLKTKEKLNNNIIAGDLETIILRSSKTKVNLINKGEALSLNNYYEGMQDYSEKINRNNAQMVPYLAAIKGVSSAFNYYHEDPTKLFKTFFLNLFVRKHRNHHIYFHNLSGFDGQFLLSRLVNLGYDIDPIINNGKLISIEVRKEGKKNDIWTLKDSNLILLSSLKNLSLTFLEKEEKGIFPYYLSDINYSGPFPPYKFFDKFKTSLEEYQNELERFKASGEKIWNFKREAVKYCIQDCDLLFKILIKFNKFIFKKYKLHLNDFPTLPSLAFAIFRSKYLPTIKVKIPQITGKIRSDLKLSYTGGSTDMFIPMNLINEQVYAYDVNALYPSVMMNNDMPVGDPTFIEFKNHLILDKDFPYFGFFYAEVNAPIDLQYPILQIHHNSKTISPTGKFSGWFFSEELKNSLKFGYKIEVVKGYQFERANIFKDWVKDQYEMRLNYPKTDSMNYIAKILLNSLYGRFGMSDSLGTFELLTDSEFNDLILGKSEIEEVVSFKNKHLVKFKNVYSLEEELNSPFSNVNIAFSSAITSYARIDMSIYKHKDFLDSLGLKLFYSDTDSLYLNGPLPDSFVNSKILGKLKLEGIFTKGVFLAPKVYALQNEKGEIIKIKGLSKKSIFENNITLEKLEKLLIKDSNFNSVQSKWFKSLESGTIEILEQTYNLKVTNNKRELIYFNEKLVNTKPIYLN
jgi:hypothetical protein